MPQGLIYLLCAATSLASALLLWRGARRWRNGLLFWSSLCFFAMAANNVMLYINYHDAILPDFDLLLACRVATVIGILLLNFGLIWHGTLGSQQ